MVVWLGLFLLLLTRAVLRLASTMSHMYFYQEMCSILRRMEDVLPVTALETSPSQRLNTHSTGKEPWYAVIEANPIAITHPPLQSARWRFAGTIPAAHQEQGARREFVDSQTTMQTRLPDSQVNDEPCARDGFPCGLSFWQPSDSTRRLLPLIRRDLDALFAEPETCGEEGCFALPGNKHLCYQDCMDLVRCRSPYLYKACWEYARLVCHMLEMDYRQFVTSSRLRIRKHDPAVGSPLRLSQSTQSRYDGGPVIIVSLGIPLAVHDLAPTLQATAGAAGGGAEMPMRVTVSDGVMMLLDGDVRARYSRGVPRGWGGGMPLYTLEIHMDCIDSTTILDYEAQTRTMVMYTPVCLANVITTRPAPVSRVHPHVSVRNNTLWRIVQGMRARLQAAESHLIRQRYHGHKATPVNRPDSAGPAPRGLWD